jgi:hypothetical protein
MHELGLADVDWYEKRLVWRFRIVEGFFRLGCCSPGLLPFLAFIGTHFPDALVNTTH